MSQYAPFFQTLHDEIAPVGHLGRGTHYSVLRCLTWVDGQNRPIPTAAYHDFAVIWDEDHDTRIMDVVFNLHCRGLLGAALFIGERKGSLTYLMDNDYLQELSSEQVTALKINLEGFAQPDDSDSWPLEIGSIEQPLQSSIIHAPTEKVEIYLKNIRQLWELGVKPI